MNLTIKMLGIEVLSVSTGDSEPAGKLTPDELRGEIASISAGSAHVEMGFKPNTPPLRHSLDRWEPDQWQTSES